MNGQKIDFFYVFLNQEINTFFHVKTKHQPYVTLANFLIKDPAHAVIFLSHTTHLTMTTLKALQDKDFSDFLGSQKRVHKNGLFLE
ncbi:hypothetical protein F890_00052 [Acinetobacter sp. CIP 64.7]|nr:hypothetical protein F890_00052 [Acinetobacter sp. CIP 64.7]